jgi:predicted DNA-binding helix-hairpin-helix protein
MFYFTHDERRGFVFCLISCLCGLCVQGGFFLFPAIPSALAQLSSPRPPAVVDINHAGYDELLSLPGIGPGAVKHIIGAREKAGRFQSVDELHRVIDRKAFQQAAPFMEAR